MKVIVGTTNNLKIKAVADAFKKIFKKSRFEVVGVDVNSGVPSAPIGDGLVTGAITRARKALKSCDGKTSCYAVGVESGAIEMVDGKYLMETTAVCVIFRDGKAKKHEYTGIGPAVPVPKEVNKRMLKKGTDKDRSASYEAALKTVREIAVKKGNGNVAAARDSVSMYLAGQYTRGDVITSATVLALMQSKSEMYK